MCRCPSFEVPAEKVLDDRPAGVAPAQRWPPPWTADTDCSLLGFWHFRCTAENHPQGEVVSSLLAALLTGPQMALHSPEAWLASASHWPSRISPDQPCSSRQWWAHPHSKICVELLPNVHLAVAPIWFFQLVGRASCEESPHLPGRQQFQTAQLILQSSDSNEQ